MDVARSVCIRVGALLAAPLVFSCEKQPDRQISAQKQAPDFSCYRQIKNYNEGACPWTLATDARQGNVWFRIVSCDKADEAAAGECIGENGPCTVGPTCIASIQYTYTAGVSSGDWYVTDRKQRTGKWHYVGQTNPISDECPKIQHDGSTGPINLNDPADGDITFSGCDWGVPAKRGSSTPPVVPKG